MNFVQQLEESLRDLAAESRNNHPGVKEASERATLKLRSLQNEYVSAVRKAKTGGQHPTTSLFQSSDILHPFLLAANYPTAGTKLRETTFRAFRLLMEADAVVPSDAINLIRVWIIQAHVAVTYYQKAHLKEGTIANTASAAPTTTSSTTASSSASGSWFSGWTSTASKQDKGKNLVSSSSGQTGQSTYSAKEMEKLALDILSCLVQLFEQMRNRPESLSSTEVWSHAVSLGCMWFPHLPSKHTVSQAARSTVSQVLSLLFELRIQPIVDTTWEDMLRIVSDGSENAPLRGAFSLCRSQGSTSAVGGAQVVVPSPDTEFALELMSKLWKHVEASPQTSLQTLELTLTLLKKSTDFTMPRFLRLVQWTEVLLTTRMTDFPKECRDIMLVFVEHVVNATEACRKQHDFEDGYIFTEEDGANDGVNKEFSTASSCLIPVDLLWRCGLVLEVIYNILGSPSERCRSFLLDSRFLQCFSEALSDFATIGASCREHILQLVAFSREWRDQKCSPKPSLIRGAEHQLAAGNLNSATGFETKATSSDRKRSSQMINVRLGEALWLSFRSILLMLEHIKGDTDESGAVDGCFAHSLALLQHWLKRFVGSSDLVRLALRGYEHLSDVFLPSQTKNMQQKALLTSLCKLSLPTWGKRDATCRLHSQHVLCLSSLIRIVHVHGDHLSSDWDLILSTFEELSIMPIASDYLSDEFYNGALALSSIFTRLPAFSTCIGNDSLHGMVKALVSIGSNLMQAHDVITGRDTVLVDKSLTKEKTDEKTTMSGKIMSAGVKVLYGSSGTTKAPSQLQERSRDTYFEEYRRNFSKRVLQSSIPIRVSGEMPFVLLLLADVTMSNAFRFNQCGEIFSSLLSELASSSQAARPFVMDIMAMMTTSQLLEGEIPAIFVGPGQLIFDDPMQSQMLAVEHTILNTKGEIQGTQDDDTAQALLSPLCTSLRTTTKPDVAESALQTVHSVLEGSGHKLHGDTWIIVIQTIASLSGEASYEVDRTSSEWAVCSQEAFKTLKLIVDDFSRQLHEESDQKHKIREALFSSCASFGQSCHDLNMSLTSIGLLRTIADQDPGTSGMFDAIRKLELIATDGRQEVRNTGMNTLVSCIIGKGSLLNASEWERCICEHLIPLYDRVAGNKKDGGDKKKGFLNPSRYTVTLHHSRNSTSKLWMSTQVILLRGFERILKNFFPLLLDSAKSLVEKRRRREEEIPWFQDSWVRILDFAYDAATTRGERDTLDFRLCGVELLVVSAQASSKAGIHAAIGPARYGTNMEVVNGALRSVRESTSFNRELNPNNLSEELDSFRESLFVEAFESLEGFVEHQEKASSKSDDTFSQVILKFCTLLLGVHACCELYEFSEDNAFKAQSYFECIMAGKAFKPDQSLEDRFIDAVETVLVFSRNDSKSRYLNQSQRACFDIFESIAGCGSFMMMMKLLQIAGPAIHSREATDFHDDTEQGEDSTAGNELLHIEASRILLKCLEDGRVEKKVAAVVTMIAIKGFVDTRGRVLDGRKAYYKRLIAYIERGASAIDSMSTVSGNSVQGIVSAFWGVLMDAIRLISQPVDLGKGLSKISRAHELKELVKVAGKYVPHEKKARLTESVEEIAVNTLEVMDLNAIYCKKNPDTDRGKKSRRHCDELLHLFSACFELICELDPSHESLTQMSTNVLARLLEYAYHPSDTNEEYHETTLHAGLAVCRALSQFPSMESTVISVFPLLCQLLLTESPEIRSGVVKVLTEVNIKDAFGKDNASYLALEKRAVTAEQKADRLSKQIESLRRTNRQLEEEVKVLRRQNQTSLSQR